MTPRQRVLSVLRGGQADRVPWIPLCSGTYFSSLPEYGKFIADGREAVREEYIYEAVRSRVEFYRSVGAEYMEWGTTSGYRLTRSKVRVNRREKDDQLHTEYETPIGSLASVWVYSDKAHTWFPKKELIEGPDDLRIYEYIVQDTAYEPDYDELARRLEIVREDGVLFIGAPPPPLKDFLLGTMRLDRAIFALKDYPKSFEHLLEIMDKKNGELCSILANSPGQVFMDTAVTGTGMISPEIFSRHYLPCTKRYADIFHRKGKLYLNHASGEPVRDLLALIGESGIDGLYGLSYSSGIKPSEVQEALPGVAVMGGIDSDFIHSRSPEEITVWTSHLLQEMAPGNRFLLGTADDVPYGTPVENLRTVSEAVEKFGKNALHLP